MSSSICRSSGSSMSRSNKEPRFATLKKQNALIIMWALIEEEFGNGIMSAIDFETHLERRSDPKGDRVVVTMDGKFLPYRKW